MTGKCFLRHSISKSTRQTFQNLRTRRLFSSPLAHNSNIQSFIFCISSHGLSIHEWPLHNESPPLATYPGSWTMAAAIFWGAINNQVHKSWLRERETVRVIAYLGCAEYHVITECFINFFLAHRRRRHHRVSSSSQGGQSVG